MKKEVIGMSDCPYIDYDSRTIFGNYDDKYICKVTGIEMDVDSTKVKHICKGYGDEYKNCPIYKDKRW